MADIGELFRRYRKNRLAEDRNRIAEAFLPLVDQVAGSVFRKVPRGVQFEDLRSLGCIGLLDAVEKFDLSRRTAFKTYAVPRIRGAILDGLRNEDFAPRLTRGMANRLERARTAVERRKGRPGSDREVALELGVSMEDLDRILLEVGPAISPAAGTPRRILDRDPAVLPDMALMEDRGKEGPLGGAERRDLLQWCLKGLGVRSRLIMRLYYVYDLRLAEIGTALDLSESRVCQVHARTLASIRRRRRSAA